MFYFDVHFCALCAHFALCAPKNTELSKVHRSARFVDMCTSVHSVHFVHLLTQYCQKCTEVHVISEPACAYVYVFQNVGVYCMYVGVLYMHIQKVHMCVYFYPQVNMSVCVCIVCVCMYLTNLIFQIHTYIYSIQYMHIHAKVRYIHIHSHMGICMYMNVSCMYM